TTRMQLEVVDSTPLGPGMQRLVLTAPELAGLQYQPGQDMMLMVVVDGDRPVRRRYTIRALDRERRLLTLDVVRHAGGPGERWGRRPRRWPCHRAGGTPTWPARPRSGSGCGRRWPRAGWRRSRSRPRRTGDGAGRTPPTANPPGTARTRVL